ncbi:MAG: hypothetical protein QM791_10080 [Ferruginibacter sp.]
MRRLFRFIISHAIFIALCAASLVCQTALLLNFEVSIYLVIFIFFSTLCSYNFHWLLGSMATRRQLSTGLILKQQRSLPFFVLGLAGLILFYIPSGISSINLLYAFLLTFIYSIPLMPFKHLAFTRKAGFLKTLLLAFTWTFVTAYIPIQTAGRIIASEELLLLLRRFLFMLMLCILFDNRDISTDKIKGLHSLATDLSPGMMRWLIYGVFALLFILPVLLGEHGITVKQSLALQLVAVITLVTYFYSRKKQGYFFYYFWVDGLMLLSALLTTIASI